MTLTRRFTLLTMSLAFVASLLVVLPGSSDAADPGEGTVSPASPLTTWVGGATVPANVAPSSGETDACPPRESDPNNVLCDHYVITVDGVEESDYENAQGTLTLSMAFDNADDDWDFGLYRPGGTLPVATAISGANPEVIQVSNPTGTYELRGAPYTATEGYQGTAEFTIKPIGATVDPVAPGFQAFSAQRITSTPEEDVANTEVAYKGKPIAFANSDIGHGALEPSIGVDPDGNAYIPALGFDSDDLATTIRRSNDDGASWQDVTPQLPLAGQNNPPNSNDPYIYVDEDSGWIFSMDLQALTNYTLNISEDGGESWRAGGPDPTGVVQDHQTLTTGVVPENTLATTTGDFEEIIYYCFNRIAESTCSRSLDGGTVWARTGFPAFPGVDPATGSDIPFCGGLHGHIETDGDGFLLLPKGHCSQPWLGVSEDAGETWRVSRVADDITFPEQQASVTADSAGNYYYAFYDTNGLPYLAVSRDRGLTWDEPMMIAPPGVTEVQWPTAYAGDEGRVSVGFPCTRAEGDAKTSLSRPWDYCMVMSVNALDDDPTWLGNVANEIGDPVHRGMCPGRCGNMYDFLDVTAAPPSAGGNVWAVYTDTCTDKIFTRGGGILGEEGEPFRQCNTDPDAVGFDGTASNSSDEEAGFAVRQVCGPNLFDLPDITEACDLLGAPSASAGGVRILGGEVAVAPVVDGQVNARSVKTERVAGENRYATAAQTATKAFPAGADTVYIATGELFPDGLSGAPAAAKDDAPVLLTPRDSLAVETGEVLDDFVPSEIVIVGGPNAISPAVEAEITTRTGVAPRRIAGATRYDTAALVSADAYPDGADIVFVATGLDFPDALSGAAAAAFRDAPVLLTATDSLPASTKAELARLSPNKVYVLGGNVAISQQAESEIAAASGVTPERLAGETRYDTAVVISQENFPSRRTLVYLATGQSFPDALAGAAAAGQTDSPVLLTSRTQLAQSTGDEIVRLLSPAVIPARAR